MSLSFDPFDTEYRPSITDYTRVAVNTDNIAEILASGQGVSNKFEYIQKKIPDEVERAVARFFVVADKFGISNPQAKKMIEYVAGKLGNQKIQYLNTYALFGAAYYIDKHKTINAEMLQRYYATMKLETHIRIEDLLRYIRLLLRE